MKKIYTPMQVGMGTFFGGPLAALYFLNWNFTALSKPDKARNILLFGTPVLLVFFALVPYLPHYLDKTFPLLYLIPTMILVSKYQMTYLQIKASDEYQAESNWFVFFISIFWALILVITLTVVYTFMISMNWIDQL